MIRFVDAFPDEQIVSAVRRQLSWTHFRSLICCKRNMKLRSSLLIYPLFA